MPKICYLPKTFNPVHRQVIDEANRLITQYRNDYNLTLSLRQLYYRFIAADTLPESWRDKATGSKNNERSYGKLGDIVTQARLAGEIDWNAIEDRGRWLRGNSHTDSAEEAIDEAVADGFLLDSWAGQDYRPEVWIEKDALVGVLDSACPDLDVNYFSCRGYTSITEVWKAARRMLWYKSQGQIPVIIHLGDHDPSGIDMSRDIVDRLELFYGSPIEFKRIALNQDQIDEYQPPPNPAKVTDSRFASYVDVHGEDCYELDALEPNVLIQVIQDTITPYRDEDIYAEVMAKQDYERDLIRRAVSGWPERVQVLREDDEQLRRDEAAAEEPDEDDDR